MSGSRLHSFSSSDNGATLLPNWQRPSLFRGCARAVQMLLNKGVDMNLPGKHGNTLCLASRAGHDRVVQMLVKRGAR
jgi:hypothetical protein